MIKYWLWLSSCQGLTPLSRSKLLDQFGTPEEIYHADPDQFLGMALTAKQLEGLTNKSMGHAYTITEDCSRHGIQIMTFQDANYPQRLREIPDPPCVLYYKGRLPDVDGQVSIGVVGTRKATSYGIDMARMTGQGLAATGVTVISGMALGVDSAALSGALEAGGTPVAVLGGGLDIIYPKENQELFQALADRGGVVSEYPPTTPHQKGHFPVRNRIISGLSWGVVAVEAGLRSGTGITARLALEQDRDLFAYPGQANASSSAGTNRLIQEGAAMMVLSPEDIVREYGLAPVAPTKHSPAIELATPKKTRAARGRSVKKEVPAHAKSIDKEEKKAYITLQEASAQFTPHQFSIMEALNSQPVSCDDLVERTGIAVGDVLSALTILQVQGFIKEVSGRRFGSTITIEAQV